MEPAEIAQTVIAKVAEITGEDESEITTESKLDKLDSFDTMELVDQLEKALEITPSYERVLGLETVGALVELCQELVDAKS